MYIAGFVIPVPEEKMEAYRKWAENGAAIFKEYGCIEIVESWEDNVPTGKYTDFRRAVAINPTYGNAMKAAAEATPERDRPVWMLYAAIASALVALGLFAAAMLKRRGAAS